MDREPDHADARRPRPALVNPGRVLDRDTELVLVAAGCDLVRRVDGDIGVHAKRGGRVRAEPLRDFAERGELGFRLHVQLADSRRQRLCHLVAGLADAGKHDVRRANAGRHGAGEFPAGDDVRAGTEPGEGAYHREVRVGLDPVADLRVQTVQGAGELAIGVLDRGLRIDVDGRAAGLRYRFQRDPFRMKPPVPIGECGHEGGGPEG